MGTQRESRRKQTCRWLRRAGLTACLAAGLGLPVFAQPPLDEMVTPERVTMMARQFDQLDAAGKSAVLDFFVEAANKPSDRVSDNYALQVAIRAAGPTVARLAEADDPKLRLQALAALGQMRANSEVVFPVWERALAENREDVDRAVGLGMLGYLKRGQLIRDTIRMQARLGFLDAALADLLGVASLLPRLQASPSIEARTDVYEGVGAFFDLLENIAPELRGEENPQAFASAKRQLPMLPDKLASFFAAASRRLPAAPPEEAKSILTSLEKIAEVSVADENFLEVKYPRRPVGRLLQPDLRPQGVEAAKALVVDLRKTLPAVAGLLKAPDAQVRLGAANTLESMAGEALQELPSLLAALKDPNPFVRWSMVRTLGKLSSAKPKETPEIVNALTPLLADADLGVCAVTAIALEQFGEQAAPAAQALGVLAGRKDAALQLAGVRALAAVGPAAKDGVDGLAIALSSQDERVREQAAGVLAKLGPAAIAAVPALQAALADVSSSVRLRAAEALVRVQAPSLTEMPKRP